jgi:hypothetical protein
VLCVLGVSLQDVNQFEPPSLADMSYLFFAPHRSKQRHM